MGAKYAYHSSHVTMQKRIHKTFVYSTSMLPKSAAEKLTEAMVRHEVMKYELEEAQREAEWEEAERAYKEGEKKECEEHKKCKKKDHEKHDTECKHEEAAKEK